MAFLSQFSKYFSGQERETELYALWSSIGVNTEKAILEELEKVNTEMTDINSFTEDTLRSWLAFFLQKIPYRTTATTQVTTQLNNELITINGDPDNGVPSQQYYKYAQTIIPQYSQLKNEDGYIYTTLEKIILTAEGQQNVTAVQGRRITEQGTYNSIIKVQATNPDLSYMTVTLNGKEIPEVSYQTSYDQLSFMGSWKPETSEGHTYGGTPFIHNGYGTKGQFYTVIGDGYCKFSDDSIPIEFKTGDLVVFDGISWQRSAANNNLQPIQFADTFAIPYNGYFAYYYGGFLYIKIYSGTEVDNPEGLEYTVSYISSNGILGETDANTLTYVSTFQDANEQNVELIVSNTKSSVAVNEPGVGKLTLYLKQRLYGSINLSSIPEYTAWFKAQPEVGDCVVLSDWEKYRRSGMQSFELSGYIDVFATDNDGKELTEQVKLDLLDRIEKYKDIGVIRFYNFTPIQNYYVFNYTSVNGSSSYQQYIRSVVEQFYSLPYLQSINSSLFESVDLAAVIEEIQSNKAYDSTGLVVRGYHYYKNDTRITSLSSFQIGSYNGEKVGDGWYMISFYVEGSEEPLPPVKFIENVQANGVCYIYKEGSYANPVGTHIDNIVSFYLTSEEYSSYKGLDIECFWGMANPGILDIGSENGLRRLAGVSIEPIGS